MLLIPLYTYPLAVKSGRIIVDKLIALGSVITTSVGKLIEHPLSSVTVTW